MDFALDDDQEVIKSLVERFVADRYAVGARASYRAQANGFDPTNWSLLAELGVLAVPLPESNGGLGGGWVEIATIAEVLGRGLVAEPFLAEIVVGAGAIAAAGTSAQRDTWLPRIIGGKAHVALAYAEHGSRFDLDRVETRVANGRVTGVKTIVEGGADAYVVTAGGEDGIVPVLVAGDAPGVERRDYRLIDGAVAAEIIFADVPTEAMAAGFDALAPVIERARVAAVAEMVGIAETLFETTLNYVRQRRQFGTAIGSFQVVQHRLADQFAALELCRSHLFRALTGDAAAIAGAKAFVSTAAVRLGEECIQLHGGMGVSDELELGHGHKRIIRLASLFGDAAFELRRYDAAIRRAA